MDAQVAPEAEQAKKIEEVGNAVSSFVLDAFQMYASGDFDSWKEERTAEIESTLCEVTTDEEKKVCERILVERMKEKDFFCCDLCQVACFNYKHALIHFTSSEHISKETKSEKASHSKIKQFRSVLNSFSKLPNKLREQDVQIETGRFRKCGRFDRDNMTGIRPSGNFVYNLDLKYCQFFFHDFETSQVWNDSTGKPPARETPPYAMLEATEIAVSAIKGPKGKKAMAELHRHLGNAPTFCPYCNYKTGDRNGFYAHLISSVHMKRVGEDIDRFCILTLLVNVHKKHLV